VKKTVKKSKGTDKVAYVMREFKEGKLKDRNGKTVTDHNKAIAIALSEAGLSNKSLMKAEIKNKLRAYRAELQNMLRKEIADDKAVKAEILKLFRGERPVTEVDIHALAERLQILPRDIEDHIYNILRSFVSGGKSQGKIEDVDASELAQGIQVEQEHTNDKDIAEKIARDHLAEDPKYYSKLKTIEPDAKPVDPAVEDEAKQLSKELPGDIPQGSEVLFEKIYAACRHGGGSKEDCSKLAWSEVKNELHDIAKARSVGGYESPEPGDLPEAGKKILASTYASCRKDGGDKEKCAKIAWSAVHNAGYSK
jgi:cation transport regulator ChaB